MSIATDKLREMVTVAPSQITDIGNSIGQIDDQVDEVIEEIVAITDGACTPGEASAISIIESLIPEDGYVTYGPTFGVSNINWSPAGNLTDWEIFDEFDVLYYTYTPEDYPDLDELVTDFAFNNDYLTRPLTDGASYGLIPYRQSLEYAQSILYENQNKISNSITILSKYATGAA